MRQTFPALFARLNDTVRDRDCNTVHAWRNYTKMFVIVGPPLLHFRFRKGGPTNNHVNAVLLK